MRFQRAAPDHRARLILRGLFDSSHGVPKPHVRTTPRPADHADERRETAASSPAGCEPPAER